MTTDESNVRHGIDGWGLEKFSRETTEENGVRTEVGYYLYERTKPFEQRLVTKILSQREVVS